MYFGNDIVIFTMEIRMIAQDNPVSVLRVLGNFHIGKVVIAIRVTVARVSLILCYIVSCL